MMPTGQLLRLLTPFCQKIYDMGRHDEREGNPRQIIHSEEQMIATWLEANTPETAPSETTDRAQTGCKPHIKGD